MISPLLSMILSVEELLIHFVLHFDGSNLLPPNAHAMASRTDVFPCPFFPPMIVNPFFDGSSFTALIFYISNSNVLILILFCHDRPPVLVFN